jgi:hypothetical protein
MQKWILELGKMPDFDGQYLCDVAQKQECGNIWNYFKVIHCKNNKWILDLNEIVLAWKCLNTSPEFENKEIFAVVETLKGLVNDVDTLLSDEGIEWQQAGYFNQAKEVIKSIDLL